MPPCCDLSVKINKQSQTGKEWVEPMVVILPPNGSAGSGHRKEFPSGAVSGH